MKTKLSKMAFLRDPGIRTFLRDMTPSFSVTEIKRIFLGRVLLLNELQEDQNKNSLRIELCAAFLAWSSLVKGKRDNNKYNEGKRMV